MQTKFTMDPTIPSNDPLVMIKADRLEDEAKEIFEYVHRYKSSYNNVIPIKTDDKIVMLKTDQIILADISQTTLMLYCMDAIYTTKETLTHFQNRVNRQNFVQISKHASINIYHLLSLSDSFSGNMTARLTNNIKSSVSRKYVKLLMDYLGL